MDALGGRMHVRCDEGAAARLHGNRVFFAELLTATGVFERWPLECPVVYHGSNALDKRDLLRALVLACSPAPAATRTSPRCDAVAAHALGINHIVSEDVLCRALKCICEFASTALARLVLMHFGHPVREAAIDKPLGARHRPERQPLDGRHEGEGSWRKPPG